MSQTIPVPKSSNLSCAESAKKIALHLFKIFLGFCCLGWKLLCVRLLRRFLNCIYMLVTDRNLFNRFQDSGRLRLVLIRDGLFFLAHERMQNCVEFGTANKRVKCKEFCRIMKKSLSVMGFIRFTTPSACRERVSTCVNRGGKKKGKRKRIKEEKILEGAPLQYVREYSTPLIRIVGECNAW